MEAAAPKRRHVRQHRYRHRHRHRTQASGEQAAELSFEREWRTGVSRQATLRQAAQAEGLLGADDLQRLGQEAARQLAHVTAKRKVRRHRHRAAGQAHGVASAQRRSEWVELRVAPERESLSAKSSSSSSASSSSYSRHGKALS